MKKSIKNLFIICLVSGMFIPATSFSQYWGGRGKPSFWDNWSINGNVGLTSFFGDLSLYDDDITGKLTKESRPALSAILTKYYLDNKIGIGGQLLYGGLKGENGGGISFEANVVEYNFQVRCDLVSLIWPDNLSGFGIDFYAGAGQFVFKVTQWDMRQGQEQVNELFTGVPEFVYFGGAGMHYKINDKFAATADMSLRQAQNDKLDDLNKNDNYDYYTHFSVGVTYYIDSFKKQNGFSRGKSTRGRQSGRLPMRRRR